MDAFARQHGHGVPVIALTTDAELRNGAEVGAAAVLPEPYELDELLALVLRYCAGN